MNNYIELAFTLNDAEDYQKDLLINSLAEIGFDTFEETSAGFNAYIPSKRFNEEQLQHVLGQHESYFPFSYETKTIEQQNWNEVWESNFEPLVIAGKCYVRATFHEPRPEFPFEIVIDPKMAFGTGHHQTTTLMMELMFELGLNDQAVLDMGCGTGILGILAEKLGATHVVAIDNDEVCYQSTIENSALNRCKRVQAACGSKEAIPGEKFDTILANINRNILLDQIETYSNVLKSGGTLLLSGFYRQDIEVITTEASTHGLTYRQHRQLNDWVAVKFEKA